MDAVAAQCWFCKKPVGCNPVSDRTHKLFCSQSCKEKHINFISYKEATNHGAGQI